VAAQIRLSGIVADYWQYVRTSQPELAARVGTVVTRLPDPTQDGEKKDAQFARATLAALDEVLVDALTEDAYVTWFSLRWEMEALAGWSAFHWTRLTDLSPGNSVFDRSIGILRAHVINDSERAERYVNLVAAVANLAHALRVEYAERAQRDIRLSQRAAERASAHVRNLIAPAESSPFRLPDALLAIPDTTLRSWLARSVTDVIVQRVNPALDSLATLLEQEHDRASDSLSISRFPGGAQHYATLLRYKTTLDVTPADAHAIGLREVARIAAIAAEARRRAGLPVNRDSLRAVLRRDSMFVLDERRSVGERAAIVFEHAVKDLDSLFGRLPAMGLSIAALPIESEMSAPVAVYDGPSATRPSARYLLNIAQLETRSALLVPGLVIGDLMPGLHLQQGTQFENAALPSFRRLAHHDGFVRGWQTYVLAAADSLSTTLAPWERFSLRMRELAAACGLVVDTGINALGWTRTDALAFLRAYLPDDDADLEREFIDPATESPGTLPSATLGARELHGLGRWAMRELGDRFQLAEFHREVLRVGSVPLPVLGSHLERWIWEKNNAAAAPPPGGGGR
jgi:uncharacterized protein (DUF885 family)